MMDTSREFTLWRIEGEESGESSGGDATYYALTVARDVIPDPDAVIASATDGTHAFYDVRSITQIGSIQLNIPDDALGSCFWPKPWVNAPGIDLDPQIADLIGRIIWESSKVRSSCPA